MDIFIKKWKAAFHLSTELDSIDTIPEDDHMPFQTIKEISVRRLRLWSENPRDPFIGEKTNLDIIKHAAKHWNLKKLASEMGNSFDHSELPTVVRHGDKNIVYDGNRRVILAMIYHETYKHCKQYKFKLPEFPPRIPCNVCDQQTAFENIYRKHSDTGSWTQLNRDIFLHKHLNEAKTPLLLIEELTGLVSKSKYLDQRYVGEEVFKENILEQLGIKIDSDKIVSHHSIDDIHSIVLSIENLIKGKKISTRKNRSDEEFLNIIQDSTANILGKNENRDYVPILPDDNNAVNQEKALTEQENNGSKGRKTRRTKKVKHYLFGGTLELKPGMVNDLYRDIDDTYNFYLDNKSTLSDNYPAIIRMGLRLLAETAAKNNAMKMSQYVGNSFKAAKKKLSRDEKTFLANQSVNANTITQLLQTGAHNYQDSGNIDQARAISIILGKILMISEGK